MTTNLPLSIGDMVLATKSDGTTVRERIYNVISKYDDAKDRYDNTYWLRGTVGSFKTVEKDTRRSFKTANAPKDIQNSILSARG